LKRKLFIFSSLFPLLSILIFPPKETLLVGGKLHEYAMGFPFHFIWYRSFDEFAFKLSEFSKIKINFLYYFLSVVILYIVLLCLVRIVKIFK